MTRERKTALIIGAIIALIVGWVIIQAISSYNKGTLEMQRAPSNMTFTVDGKPQKALSFKLSAGEHTIQGTSPGFATTTEKITIKRGETLKKDLLLVPSDYRGETWLQEHPDEAGLYSAKSSEQFDKDSEAMVDDNPIVLQLPQYGPGWTITYGSSVKYPNKTGAVAIHIWGSDPDMRQEALRWMRENGFDPSDMEIIIDKD